MICKCIKKYKLVNFIVGNYYEYKVDIHTEISINIYTVTYPITSDYCIEHPFLEDKFNEYFDNTQQIREDKLNIILE